ncbi:hypothetical protein [Bradyrhizobium canariense]|uniref:hypothetical protein n=1 Tax=Bradyrhizobium canariense TaxID=255045 RepID=UPI0011BA9B84|nr:hypothetical protein [Bradyrhizobium canariense]
MVGDRGGFTAARRAIAAEICGNDLRKCDEHVSRAERQRLAGMAPACGPLLQFNADRGGCPIIVRIRR